MDENSDKTCSTGLTQEVSVVLAYIFVWIGGVLFLALEKKNDFVRFHAMQSTILGIVATAVIIVLSILSILPLLGFLIAFIVKPAFVVAYWILVIVLIVKINSGQNVRLPIVADLADLWLVKIKQG